MPGLWSVFGLVAIVWLTACWASSLSGHKLADAIQERYEAELISLPFAKQRHYAQRLYRITGDDKYLPVNLCYANHLLLSVGEDIAGLKQSGYAASRSRELIAGYPIRTAKQRARQQMLGEWGEIAFARSLLFRLVQLDYYQLLDSDLLVDRQRALDYLAMVDFAPFLTDPDVIAIYAAQVANTVHYLHQLGIADLRDEVVSAFRARYPPESNAALSHEEYLNKVYGMTHFVIAASRYYQKPVRLQEYAWILQEFEKSLPRILDETTEDIYIEVGISFMLAGQHDHTAIGQIKASLARAYDRDARLIPSPIGDTELDGGEHRNVLAIVLLRWPQSLSSGPDLSALDVSRVAAGSACPAPQ
ncbi:MAG: DUF3541 domain-containing protein [Gammaproteobacteria bacterium]